MEQTTTTEIERHAQRNEEVIPLTTQEFEQKLADLGAIVEHAPQTMPIHQDPIATKDGRVIAFWID